MKMAEGVEWAVHCCILLHWAERDAIPAAKLAEFHDLPAVYLNKQLQALGRAGIARAQDFQRHLSLAVGCAIHRAGCALAEQVEDAVAAQLHPGIIRDG